MNGVVGLYEDKHVFISSSVQRPDWEAVAELRVPIFENKVVEHIIGQATVKDKSVSVEALFGNDEDDDAEEKPKSKPKAKTKPKTKPKGRCKATEDDRRGGLTRAELRSARARWSLAAEPK